MTTDEALEIINTFEQNGGIIITDMTDQVENGEWSIDENGKAVPYVKDDFNPNNIVKSSCSTHFTTSVYLYKNLKDYYEEEPDIFASFDTLKEAILGTAEYIKKYNFV